MENNIPCHGYIMTDKGPLCPSKHRGAMCQALTDLMAPGGKLLIGDQDDMARSSNRLKTKPINQDTGEYCGPSVDNFESCTNVQKRIVCYHKLYRFLYGVGITGDRVAPPASCVLRIKNQYSDPLNPACREESYIEATFQDGLQNI